MVRRARADDDDQAAAATAELFTVRPEEFVAARNAAVKALKAVGEREQAAKVAALRRPTPVDWALNCVALEHADTVEQFLDAATAARDAQAAAVEGRAGGDLRAAVGTLRDASGQVARLVDGVLASSGKPSGASTGAVTSRLTAVAASSALGAQLRQHRLGSGTDETEELFAGLEQAAVPAKRERVTQPTKAKSPPPKAAPERDLARALAAAERAQSSAMSAVARAAERVRRAEATVLEAEERLESARLACASASAEHDRLAQAADDASRDVDSAKANLAAARSHRSSK